jgi:hypothetical protein
MCGKTWGWRRVGPDPTDIGLGVSIPRMNQIAFAIRDGEANPEDARLLMDLFCESVKRGAVPDRLMKHFQGSFQRYLDTGCTINGALGLTRNKRGAPKRDEQRIIELAAALLRARLAGELHQEALETAAAKCGSNETDVGEAWGKHRLAAVMVVRNERPDGFSEDEKRKLEEMEVGATPRDALPSLDEQRSIGLAAAVLRALLAGETHQKALATVAQQFRSRAAMVGKAWRRHQMDAMAVVRHERPNGFSKDEERRLPQTLKRTSSRRS